MTSTRKKPSSLARQLGLRPREAGRVGTILLSLFAGSVAVFSIPPAFSSDETPSKSGSPVRPAGAEQPRTKSVAPGKPRQAPAPGLSVISTEKARDQERRSDFLNPPGSGRYDDVPVDWRDVPAWRQASFFGIKVQGQFFIYVVDCSGSMIDEDRLARAKEEVRRSVMRPQEPQRFRVVFYNDEPIGMPGGLPRSADLTNKSQLLAWMRLIEPDGETDPRGALSQALALRPDAVFLLSDGEFPDGTAEAVARRNSGKIPIHCVDLSSGEAGDQLRRIARHSGGKYVSRPWAGH